MGEVQEEHTTHQEFPKNGTFFRRLRPLAVIGKFLGTFPLMHVRKEDGRNLQHSWLTPIHLWDLAVYIASILFFMKSCSNLQSHLNLEEEVNVIIWITLTFFVVTFRCSIQFLMLHFYASRYPSLFTALENYHQIAGASIIIPDKRPVFGSFLPVFRTIVVLIIMETISFFYFDQLNGANYVFDAWPLALSFLLANIWRELPMNVFIFTCRYMTNRFLELRDQLRLIREKGGYTAKQLEDLRMKHSALMRILALIQSCYGMQIAMNLFFLFLDTVLQLYVFFVITSSQSPILMLLAFYYFFMSAVLLLFVENLERTGDSLLQEITEFELCSTSQEQQMQVQMFIVQLSAQPVKLSASGFFVVNKGLMCSLMGAVATYIVMLVQFTPYIEIHLANFTLPDLPF